MKSISPSRLLLITCALIPYVIAFESDDDENAIIFTSIDWVMNAFFLVDIFLNFFSAYYDINFNLIDDRKVSSLSKLPNPPSFRESHVNT